MHASLFVDHRHVNVFIHVLNFHGFKHKIILTVKFPDYSSILSCSIINHTETETETFKKHDNIETCFDSGVVVR